MILSSSIQSTILKVSLIVTSIVFFLTRTGHCGFDRFVIAYSRPRNLHDALTRMKLSEPQGFCASDFL
jgi:hypothetical protein